jgi:hypothetical protein
MSSIHQICKKAQDEGFEFGSLVNSLSITQFNSSPDVMAEPFLKPMAPTLWCSRIVTYDDFGTTLQWHSFVVDQDFRADTYAKAHLLFVKVDKSRITCEMDPRFSKGGEWRKETRYIPLIRWSRVASQYAGITVDPSEDDCRDVFPMWDVSTLAIWDHTCVTETRTFENAGTDWTYKTPQ